ncbi:hypothetical protein SAMN05444411_1144 [Lutibacter oricola]|uniref:Uncharacterized protein n=1 Tax=Lutibacter oricola TaxID=762486 RepID=A0A1H3GEN0_9FLAO|nr:hypothetical protein [Lutibacter oricola]SDY01495.1 hypothetical protein SAMN05444411_1144 [Lutibacter oricola]
MNPYFSAMKKREKSIENHKASIRKKTQKNKELYLGQNGKNQKEEYTFPKMNNSQFQEFKSKLEQERKSEKTKTRVIIIVVFIIATAVMIYAKKYI